MLDKSNPIPIYMQLQRLIREDIVSGVYSEGEKIPSEPELSKKYQITRSTVRKAVINLVNEGLLEQVHGKGTYVRFRHIKYSIWNFSGFTDYLMKKNEMPISKILEQKTIQYNHQPYLMLVRARGVKKEQSSLFLTIDTSYLPLKLFPDLYKYDFATQSLYHVLRSEYNTFPRRSEIRLSNIPADKQMEQLFKLDREQWLLMADGKVIDEQNREIEIVNVIYGPDVEFKLMATMN